LKRDYENSVNLRTSLYNQLNKVKKGRMPQIQARNSSALAKISSTGMSIDAGPSIESELFDFNNTS
jgi:hypothetical protein